MWGNYSANTFPTVTCSFPWQSLPILKESGPPAVLLTNMAKKSRSTQAVSIFYESSWVLPRGCPCHSHLQQDTTYTLHTCSTALLNLHPNSSHVFQVTVSPGVCVTGKHNEILGCCLLFTKVSGQLSLGKWLFLPQKQHRLEGQKWRFLNCSQFISECCYRSCMLALALIFCMHRSFPACSLLSPGLPRIHLPLLLYWIDLKTLAWAREHNQGPGLPCWTALNASYTCKNMPRFVVIVFRRSSCLRVKRLL